MAYHPRRYRLLGILLSLPGAGCSFDPVVRPLKPEQLSAEPAQVLSTLDARGEYALIAYPNGEVEPRVAISHWRKRQSCDVPLLGQPLSAPLPRARGAAQEAVFYLPLATAREHETLLMLVDDKCNAHGPFGAIAPETARTVISARDQRGYLLFRDEAGTLSVLDPLLGLPPRVLAYEVEAVRATLEASRKQRDAVWIVARGELSLRTLSGETLVSVGSDVHDMTLSRDGERIAFVDGADLYEAVAPRFRPVLIAQDACGARYGRDTLDFFAPCAEQALQRVDLSSGEYQEFADGVFASREQEGVQLDYSRDGDEDTQLTATYADGERVRVQPTLAAEHTYVLDQQRIAGLDDGARFGIWQRSDASFSPLLHEVAEVVPHHRGKTHHYGWLVLHDLVDGLGTLTLLDQEGATSEIARAVPQPAQQGFLVEGGSALAEYPFSAPLVVLLEEARPRDDASGRFCGQLKALSITGAPRAQLAQNVCSYAIVAAPVPGVLYGIEDGPEQGLWFVAL